MTAPNHAVTGALIGLSVGNPILAMVLAFLSHFLLDALPHYDPPGKTDEERIGSRQFLVIQLVIGGIICFLLVISLALTRPAHWVIATVCAFLAASPDLLSIPRYLSVKRIGKDIKDRHWFWKFHSAIQVMTRPRLIWFELLWFVTTGGLLLVKL